MELAQVEQVVPQVGGLALLGTALTLGLRHGIDWDHIAAISDITSTTTNVGVTGSNLGEASRSTTSRSTTTAVAAPPGGFSFASMELRALWLASLYALGHALVVVVLGLAALYFEAILPDWIDPLLERVVGITLLLLGFWVVYSLVRFWQGEGDFRLQSRWMLVFGGARGSWNALQARLHGHSHAGAAGNFHVHRVDQYGPGTAFGVGLIHGIGAETGTQVLLIAAVGGAANQGLGTAMLIAFVIGLLISNTAVALLTSTGFISASRAKTVYIAVGCLTAVFSLLVGSYFTLGIGDQLPDLQVIVNAIFGEAPA